MFGIGFFIKSAAPVSVFIAIFLLGFLLVGCTSADAAYSKVHLVRLEFNETIANSVSSNSLITELSLAAGYLGMCVLADGSKMCSTAKNALDLAPYATISVGESSLSLVEVSKALRNVCHPRLLATSLALCLVLLLVMSWLALPLVPGKVVVRRVGCGLAALALMIWGLGAMLQHQAVAGAKSFSEAALLGLVIVAKGGRAEAMTWTAFAFLLASCLALGAECFSQRSNKPETTQQLKHESS